jgi:uncharacterized protein
VLAAIAAITLFAAVILSRAVIASSLVKMFFADNPKYARYVELGERFESGEILFIAFDDPTLWTAAGMARLVAIEEVLERRSDVRTVDTIASAERVIADGEELRVERYVDLLSATPTAAESISRIALSDRLIGGLLASADGQTAAVVIQLRPEAYDTAEKMPLIIEEMLGELTSRGLSKDALHLAGLMPETAEATSVARDNFQRIFPICALVIVAIVWVLFGRLWPVTITLLVALVATIWTFAFGVLLDREVNLLMAAVPAVMIVVCTSDIIHLCSSYLLALQEGREKVEAIRVSAGEVGVACFFTSATTFVGFASMAFVPTTIFRQFGVVLGFGVAISLILAMVLVPIFFFLMRTPKPPPSRSDRAGRVIDWICARSRDLSVQRPWAVTIGFAIFCVVAVVLLWDLRVETDFSKRLGPENRIRIDQQFIWSKFEGTNVLELYVSAPAAGEVLAPEFLAAVTKLQRAIEELPRVDRAFSVVELLERVSRAFGSASAPNTRDEIAQSLLLFELSAGGGIERFVDSERSMMRIAVRLDDNGLVGTAETADRAIALAQDILPHGAIVEASGLSYLFGDWLKFIVAGQKRGLIFSVLTTALMMIWCLRSIRVGLVSMIPNVIPLVFLGAWCAMKWEAVDSDALIVAMIAIGIAVDDTIHFYSRLRVERARARSLEDAIARTFEMTGRPIVQTTVILCLGFAPFATSDYFSTENFGTLLPGTLIVALIADLLLTPALAKLGPADPRTNLSAARQD